ncbi:MAG: GNAT family N-acetyltransferase [Spirochaetes bacterium RBG_13_68_11]|nr:MAG: GNAT family N-acetyltransferase [Spirochaetes bacterium RBG_13_68_11]
MKPGTSDIDIRTDLRPGDIGAIIQMHGTLYGSEHGFGVQFDCYVALGLHEFYAAYDPGRDRVWICEHGGRMIASMLLMHRGGDTAQLRYFLIRPKYRGIGLGKRLMDLGMQFLRERGYRSVYLWTVDELPVASALYRKYGFTLTEEKPSTAFGKALREQRFDLVLPDVRPR